MIIAFKRIWEICTYYWRLLSFEFKQKRLGKFDHRKVIEEVINNAGISAYDPFDYTSHEAFPELDKCFQFCQANLANEPTFNISPARIFIRRKTDVNASAGKIKGYYIIRMNFGTVITLYGFYVNNKDVFYKGKFLELVELQSKIGYPLEYTMYQWSLIWTFYHEKAHLIQFSSVKENSSNTLWLQERYSHDKPEDAPFDLKKQIYEFDADLYASYYLGIEILKYWNSLSKEIRTAENLNFLVAIGMSSTLTYFIYLQEKYLKVYYDASDHPHPSVRLSYMLVRFTESVENNLHLFEKNLELKIALDHDNIINNAIKITDALFGYSSTTVVNNFAKMMLDEGNRIPEYVINVLHGNTMKFPELICNSGKI